jgi:UDP-N-acetylglucosamine transferase subunit ALG13
VDDHQTQIAGELARRGLAVSVEADDLTLEHLLRAAATDVAPLREEPPFIMPPQR